MSDLKCMRKAPPGYGPCQKLMHGPHEACMHVALPPPPPPRRNDDGRREAVFVALGRASMCWDEVERAGVFDSKRAVQIGEELLAQLAELDG